MTEVLKNRMIEREGGERNGEGGLIQAGRQGGGVCYSRSEDYRIKAAPYYFVFRWLGITPLPTPPSLIPLPSPSQKYFSTQFLLLSIYSDVFRSPFVENLFVFFFSRSPTMVTVEKEGNLPSYESLDYPYSSLQ